MSNIAAGNYCWLNVFSFSIHIHYIWTFKWTELQIKGELQSQGYHVGCGTGDTVYSGNNRITLTLISTAENPTECLHCNSIKTTIKSKLNVNSALDLVIAICVHTVWMHPEHPRWTEEFPPVPIPQGPESTLYSWSKIFFLLLLVAKVELGSRGKNASRCLNHVHALSTSPFKVPGRRFSRNPCAGLLYDALVDPGGTPGARPLNRIQFFRFRICFRRKVFMSEVVPTPTGRRPPPREILDPPLWWPHL